MSFLSQLLDVILGGLLAGLTTFALSAVVADQQLAVTVGVILASMFYFSRNPWGTNREQAVEINERIDALYDRILP
ncbi:hypothetical protein [Halorientalis salina]|uniref:hypothetical protein n=1 Tax=Halorientalis salina TaxID=2932266 RepID=UPI0010AD9526|nr:hypothetical protein [Halorientalis salina]